MEMVYHYVFDGGISKIVNTKLIRKFRILFLRKTKNDHSTKM
jgi:hypothetical protein